MTNLNETWGVYRINEADWFLARNLEEAIDTALNYYGCSTKYTLEDKLSLYGDCELDDPHLLSDEALDTLIFFDDIYNPETSLKRTFREELKARIFHKPKPQFFATNEI